MFKMIAVDLDGTLLNSEKEISISTQNIIKRLSDFGIEFVISTGRTYEAAKQYYNKLELQTPVISCNGGYVYNPITDNVIYGKSISKDNLIKIFKIVERNKMYCQYYTKNCIYTKTIDFLTKEWAQRNEDLEERDKANIKIIQNPIDFISRTDESIYKLLIMDEDPNKLVSFASELEDFDEIEIVKSVSKGIDIMSKGVTKGDALKRIINLYNISMEEVIAIGDNDNDIDMLKAVKLGIAMDNANENVKKIANFVTLSNDLDGVKFAIEKFIFNL